MHTLKRLTAMTLIFLVGMVLADFRSLAALPSLRLRVGYTSVGRNRAPLWIAKDQNIFNKYGLDVELVYIPGAATAVPALLSNDLQIRAGSAATTLQAASQRAKLVIFGTFGPTPNQQSNFQERLRAQFTRIKRGVSRFSAARLCFGVYSESAALSA
jgi:ABC-type nitrate/sulfonate/bicarbonate transport system substrate-binding protein